MKTENKRLLRLFFCFFGFVVVWFISCNEKLTGIICDHRWKLEILFVILVMVILYCLISKKKTDDCDTLIQLLLGAAFILAAFYVIVTPYNISDHDLGFFSGFNSGDFGDGHLGHL